VSRVARARLRTFTLGERPDLEAAVHRLVESLWPRHMEFIHHDPVCGRLWGSLYRQFAEFQPVLCDSRGAVVAAGFTIPLEWSGRTGDLQAGVDGALERGVRGRAQGRRATTLSALLARRGARPAASRPQRAGDPCHALDRRAARTTRARRRPCGRTQASLSDHADGARRSVEAAGRRHPVKAPE
jgi:hypothetical protein